MINWTQGEGVHWFMKKYTPGKSIVDVGAGYGGITRMLKDQYDVEPISMDFNPDNVEFGNRISRDLGLPEYIKQHDATQPFGVENVDACILFGVLSAIERKLQLACLKNCYDCIKPDGLFFFEDLVYAVPFEDFHDKKKQALEENGHLTNSPYIDCIRQMFIAVGFKIIEIVDVTQEWSYGSWARSNDRMLPIYETEKETLDPIEKYFRHHKGVSVPKAGSDLRNMTLKEIKERFPLTCNYLDPDYWCFQQTHNDLKMIKIVARK